MPLTDAQWALIEPLLSDRSPRRGGRWRDHREVIDAIAWKYQSGAPWMCLPEQYGSRKGVYTRLCNWALDGTWQKVFAALIARADAEATWTGSWPWTPRSCAPPARRRSPQKGAGRDGEPADHALGRSRGGLTTKIHLAADPACRPLVLLPSPGQAGDTPHFPLITRALKVARPIGRPRTRPEQVLAGKAYSSGSIREHLRRRRIQAVIPQPADQIANRKRRGRDGGRPPTFDKGAYKQRNTVERCINRLKQWRGIATRYDKTARIYQAALYIAAIFLWTKRSKRNGLVQATPHKHG